MSVQRIISLGQTVCFLIFLSESSVWSVLTCLLLTQHLQCNETQSGMALCAVLTDAIGERDREWCAYTMFYIYFFCGTSRARSICEGLSRSSNDEDFGPVIPEVSKLAI